MVMQSITWTTDPPRFSAYVDAVWLVCRAPLTLLVIETGPKHLILEYVDVFEGLIRATFRSGVGAYETTTLWPEPPWPDRPAEITLTIPAPTSGSHCVGHSSGRYTHKVFLVDDLLSVLLPGNEVAPDPTMPPNRNDTTR